MSWMLWLGLQFVLVYVLDTAPIIAATDVAKKKAYDNTKNSTATIDLHAVIPPSPGYCTWDQKGYTSLAD